jgi:energy-coupling factor transport system ATP-binding protein
MLELKNVTYTYSPKTPFEKTAVDNVSVSIAEGEILGIIGHTGSGKSTLIQLMNGLLQPTSGEVVYNGEKKTKVNTDIGMVFQYPENQIFEETVRAEIAFGPKNIGLSGNELEARVIETAELLEVPHSQLGRSPHFLSGGQKRRVAIASILAMKPKILIFDEPIAGLDPQTRNHLLELISQIKATIIFVSHSMEDVARICSRVIVMNDSKIVIDGTSSEVFEHETELLSMGLDIPEIAQVMNRLGHKNCWTVEKAVEVLNG